MDFTQYEQTIVEELEKRAGDVLYIKDIAPYFISNSYLQISTYTQTAYIQVGDNMQNALSEYFQLVVFLKKMEKNAGCFSIPYTPLTDNSIQIGNSDFKEYQQHTIADGDLLIQLFHYAAKKYVITPNASEQFYLVPKQSKANFIIPSIILFLLFLFIGGIGYQSFLDRSKLKLTQEAIRTDLKEQGQNIELLTNKLQDQEKKSVKVKAKLQHEFNSIHNSLKEQNRSLKNIWYWNREQFDKLVQLIEVSRRDSVN